MYRHYQPRTTRQETPDDRRRRWGREAAAERRQQYEQERQQAEAAERDAREAAEAWARKWAAMSPEERAEHESNQAKIEAGRLARIAETERVIQLRAERRNDPFSTFGT